MFKMEAQAKQMTRTYIDEMPWGTAESNAAEMKKSRKERRKLPEGCRRSVLAGDIMRIAWPALLELFLTSVVSMTDMIMVGAMPNGDDAISAVSLATHPKFMFVTLIIALNVGVTATIARYRGAGDHDGANNVLRNGLVLELLLTVFGTIGGYLSVEPMIRFMANDGLSPEIMRMSEGYLRIQMIGFVTSAIPATITAALRGTGNSKPPMVYNITANLVNVCGNYLLINGHFGFPALGVVGASIATVLGQLVSMVMAIICISRGRYYFNIRLKDFFAGFKVDMGIIGSILRIGLPSLGEQVILRVGIIIFSRQVASLGQPYYATHQIAMNIQSLSFLLGMGIATSSTTLVGQSLGKRRVDMAEHYSRLCGRIGILLGVVIGVWFGLFGSSLVSLYSDTQAVIAASVPVMIILGISQPFQAYQFIISGSLRGAGDTKSTALITLATSLVLRPVLGYLFISILHCGLIGAWYATIIDQLVRVLLVFVVYEMGRWKKIKL